MNREQAVRECIFKLLDGQLVYEATVIPVWDAKLDWEDDDASLYVIIEGQSATNISTFPAMYKWDCRIGLSIVSRQYDGVSRDTVDYVNEQIEFLLYNALQNGIIYDNFQFSNFALDSANSDAFTLNQTTSQVSKDLMFKIEVSRIKDYSN